MKNLKPILISFLSGVIITAIITTIIASNYYKKHPIVITKETHTTTEVTKIPKDYNECLVCLNSKGEISEKMNENVMHITYKDKCKTAYKDVTLKSIDLKRHFLTLQISNTAYENSYKNYGGLITYSYMLWDKIGISCGVNADLKSVGVSAGVSYGW
jgi:hypothetical protein